MLESWMTRVHGFRAPDTLAGADAPGKSSFAENQRPHTGNSGFIEVRLIAPFKRAA